jgi:hypothetical protein
LCLELRYVAALWQRDEENISLAFRWVIFVKPGSQPRRFRPDSSLSTRPDRSIGRKLSRLAGEIDGLEDKRAILAGAVNDGAEGRFRRNPKSKEQGAASCLRQIIVTAGGGHTATLLWSSLQAIAHGTGEIG